MIVHKTFVVCDVCGREVLGCTDLNSSKETKEANALAEARRQGYERKTDGRGFVDTCPKHSANNNRLAA